MAAEEYLGDESVGGLKKAVRDAAGGLLYRSGALSLVRPRPGVSVLAYHRVLRADSPEIETSQAGMFVTEPTFRMHMDHLKNRYRILSLEEFVDILDRGAFPDRPACLITFDDGWADNYEVAFPVLRDRGMPAVVFLSTATVGTHEIFWTERAARLLSLLYQRSRGAAPKQSEGVLEPPDLQRLLARKIRREDFLDRVIEDLKSAHEAERNAFLAELSGLIDDEEKPRAWIMNWDQIEEMARSGIAFGAHGHTHRILVGLDPGQMEMEIAEPARIIGEKLGRTPLAFCYPNGDADDPVVQKVRDAGYRAAFSVEQGVVTPGLDRLRLPRICLHEGAGNRLGRFACRAAGIG